MSRGCMWSSDDGIRRSVGRRNGGRNVRHSCLEHGRDLKICAH